MTAPVRCRLNKLARVLLVGILGATILVAVIGGNRPTRTGRKAVTGEQVPNWNAALEAGPLHPPLPYKAREIVADAWLNTPGTRGVSMAELQKHRKIVVLEFWRLDCPGCVEAIPMLNALEAKYHPRGVEFLTIHCSLTENERDLKLLSRFVREKGIRAPVAVDYSKRNATNYVVPMMLPTFLIVNRNGTVVNYLPTRETRALIEHDLDALLSGNDLEAAAKQRGKALQQFGAMATVTPP